MKRIFAMSKVNNKYQIVIPKKIREHMNLKKGAEVMIDMVGDSGVIQVSFPETDWIAKVKGSATRYLKDMGGAEKFHNDFKKEWDK